MPRRRADRAEDEPVVLALRRVRQLGIIPRSAAGGWVPQAPAPTNARAHRHDDDGISGEESGREGDSHERNSQEGNSHRGISREERSADERSNGDHSDDGDVRDNSEDGEDGDGREDTDIDSRGDEDGDALDGDGVLTLDDGERSDVAARSDVRHGAHRSDRPSLGRRLLWTVADHLPATLRAGVVAASPRAVGALALVGVLAVAVGGFHVWRSQPSGQLAPDAQVLVDGRPVVDGAATGTEAATVAEATPGMEPTADAGATVDGGAPAPDGTTGTGAHQDGSAAGPPPGDAATTAPTTVVVHVAGRVHRPGIVELPAGARVAEAIDAAGGVTEEADTTRVNLARVLVDGEQVLVLAPDEDPPPGTGAPPVAGAPPAGSAAPGTGAGAGAGAPAAVVDLNTATLADLETLPGIGPVLAQRILDWRTANGRFSSVDELREISGLGEKRIADLQGKVRA